MYFFFKKKFQTDGLKNKLKRHQQESKLSQKGPKKYKEKQNKGDWIVKSLVVRTPESDPKLREVVLSEMI